MTRITIDIVRTLLLSVLYLFQGARIFEEMCCSGNNDEFLFAGQQIIACLRPRIPSSAIFSSSILRCGHAVPSSPFFLKHTTGCGTIQARRQFGLVVHAGAIELCLCEPDDRREGGAFEGRATQIG